MNTLRKLVEGWEMSAREFSAMATSARYESSRLRYGQVCDEISNCADELSAELPKWERLEKAAQRVTDAFRALGESTPWTREADRTRHECEAAMLELDDALKEAQE